MKYRFAAPLIACLALAGCQSVPLAAQMTAANGMSEFTGLVAVREFAGPSTFLGVAPTAIVLLDPGQMARNQQFCSGFIKIETDDEIAAGVISPNAIRTRWLVSDDDLSVAPATCAEMTTAYDFVRATTVRAKLTEDANLAPSLSGVGPFIVEIMPDNSVVIFSGSTIPQAQLKSFSQNWIGAAESQYKIWSGQREDENCYDAITLDMTDMAAQAKAFYQCQFPDGITVAHAKVAVCVVAGIAGYKIPFVCREDD